MWILNKDQFTRFNRFRKIKSKVNIMVNMQYVGSMYLHSANLLRVYLYPSSSCLTWECKTHTLPQAQVQTALLSWVPAEFMSISITPPGSLHWNCLPVSTMRVGTVPFIFPFSVPRTGWMKAMYGKVNCQRYENSDMKILVIQQFYLVSRKWKQP